MEVPKPEASDYVLKIVKAAVGSVPIAGTILGELFEIVIIPDHQRKMTEWFEYVSDILQEIVEKGIRSKEDIFNDEQFTAVFQKTSRVYANNVEKNKMPIIQAFLRSSITKPLQLDKQLIFLQTIDDLNEVQFGILYDVHENENSDQYLYQMALEDKLAAKYAENDKEYLKLLVKGLKDFHLLGFGSADIVVDNINQWHMVTSNIAKELLTFLKEDN